MLLSHDQFERAVTEARRYRGDTVKRSTRSVSRSLLSTVNEGPTDPVTFAQMLLVAYLIKPRKFSAWRPHQTWQKNHALLTALFDIEPISEVDTDEDYTRGCVSIDEKAVQAPLRFRDYLSLICYQRVYISSISFGCLSVDYFIPRQAERFVQAITDQSKLPGVCADLQIRSIVLGEKKIYERA